LAYKKYGDNGPRVILKYTGTAATGIGRGEGLALIITPPTTNSSGCMTALNSSHWPCVTILSSRFAYGNLQQNILSLLCTD